MLTTCWVTRQGSSNVSPLLGAALSTMNYTVPDVQHHQDLLLPGY